MQREENENRTFKRNQSSLTSVEFYFLTVQKIDIGLMCAIWISALQTSRDGVFGPLYFTNNVLKQRLTMSIKRLTFTSTESVHVCDKLLYKIKLNLAIDNRVRYKLIWERNNH